MDWDSLNNYVGSTHTFHESHVPARTSEHVSWDWRAFGSGLITGCALAGGIVAGLRLQTVKTNQGDVGARAKQRSDTVSASENVVHPSLTAPTPSRPGSEDVSCRPAQDQISAASADWTAKKSSSHLAVQDTADSACLSSRPLHSQRTAALKQLHTPFCVELLEGLRGRYTGCAREGSVHDILYSILDGDPGQVSKEDFNFVVLVCNRLALYCGSEASDAIAALQVVCANLAKAQEINMAHVHTSVVAEQRAVLVKQLSIQDAQV
jgi:hypothetical protein